VSAVVAQPPVITPADRLGLTVCLAIIVHAVVLLGITFEAEDRRPPTYQTMEIVLVQQKSEAPEEARMLAQANLEGGGDTAEKVTPATPLPPVFPAETAEVTAPPPSPAAAEPPSEERVAEPVEKQAAKPRAEELVAVDADTGAPKAAEEEPETAEPAPAETEKTAERAATKRSLPSASELLSNSFKIAALSAELKRKLEAKAERPRRKFISASTQEYLYASYMEAWRMKVERVGNLNYPDEARRRQLSGSLILDVALNPDGSVNQITVRRSSGYQVLDDAARRIVDLAAPFAPFPDEIRAETDILHITRTWQFLNNGSFR
jgi:protein TonB